MTPKQLVGLFIRLFAIWLGISAIQMIGTGMALRDSVGYGAGTANVAYVASIILFITASIVWCFPLLIAGKLIPAAPPDGGSTSISAVETATVACIVLGLWTLVGRVLPALIWDLEIIAVYHGNYQPLQSITARDVSRLIESAADLIVALVLIFKARWIAFHLLRPSPGVAKV
jgi:hypothetical protein